MTTSYRCSRVLTLRVKNSRLSVFLINATSGVPQCSVLGPLISIFFPIDLPQFTEYSNPKTPNFQSQNSAALLIQDSVSGNICSYHFRYTFGDLFLSFVGRALQRYKNLLIDRCTKLPETKCTVGFLFSKKRLLHVPLVLCIIIRFGSRRL